MQKFGMLEIESKYFLVSHFNEKSSIVCPGIAYLTGYYSWFSLMIQKWKFHSSRDLSLNSLFELIGNVFAGLQKLKEMYNYQPV